MDISTIVVRYLDAQLSKMDRTTQENKTLEHHKPIRYVQNNAQEEQSTHSSQGHMEHSSG